MNSMLYIQGLFSFIRVICILLESVKENDLLNLDILRLFSSCFQPWKNGVRGRWNEPDSGHWWRMEHPGPNSEHFLGIFYFPFEESVINLYHQFVPCIV